MRLTLKPGRPERERGLFAGLGRAVVRHPWRVIALWVIVAVAVIATAPKLPTTASESSFLPGSYESIRAANLQDQAFPQTGHVTGAAAIIVFARADGGRLTAADSAKIAAIAATLDGRHIRKHREHHGRPTVAERPGANGAGGHAQQRGQRLGDGGRQRGQGVARRHQAADGGNRADRGRHRVGGPATRQPAVQPAGRADRAAGHARPDPGAAAGDLPQPGHRAAAAGRDRARLPGGDRPDQRRQQGAATSTPTARSPPSSSSCCSASAPTTSCS